MSEIARLTRAQRWIGLGLSTSLLYGFGVVTEAVPSPAEAYSGAVKGYKFARAHLLTGPETKPCTDTVKPLAMKAGALTLGHLPRKLSPGPDEDHVKSVRNSWDDSGREYQLKVEFKGRKGDIPEPEDVTGASLDVWDANGQPRTSLVLAPPEGASEGQDCWQIEKFVWTDKGVTTSPADTRADYERLLATKFEFLGQ